MGNFEKLSVLVIVVIIVMILVVALYTWTGDPGSGTEVANVADKVAEQPRVGEIKLKAIDPKSDKDASPRLKAKTTEEIMKEFADAAKREAGMDATPAPKIDEATPHDGPDEIKPVAVVEPRFHVVVSGETIGKIAKIEYPGAGQKAIDVILKGNPQVDPTRMAIGFKLLLPELGVTSKANDSAKNDGAKNVGGASASQPGTPPESVAVTIKPGTLYVTKKGDTLPNLARRAYRDGNQWHRIWVENFDDISDTDHLQPGLRLKIPVL